MKRQRSEREIREEKEVLDKIRKMPKKVTMLPPMVREAMKKKVIKQLKKQLRLVVSQIKELNGEW